MRPTNFYTLVLNADCNLPLKRDVSFLKLYRQCRLVNAFEKPRSKIPMHFERRANGLIGDAIDLRIRLHSEFSWCPWRLGGLTIKSKC